MLYLFELKSKVMIKPTLTSLLNIQPLIIAPMFLVSNTKMVIEGMKAGVAGCIPALNYRTLEELRASIIELRLKWQEVVLVII
jgi:nitronate monooxygenase